MTDDKVYRMAFEQAKVDLAAAVKRKHHAEVEVAVANGETLHLRRTLAALAVLCGENVEDSMGLTEAVRVLFQMRLKWTILKDIKDQIEALGVSLGDLKNPDASVLSVLNRLVAGGELQQGTLKMKSVTGAIVDTKAWKPKPATDPATHDDDIPF